MHAGESADSEATVERLESELRALEEARAAEQAAERRATVTGWIVVGTILVIVTTFVLANYVHFKREWTEENFSVSLRNELEAFNPTAMEELHAMGANLLPVYAEEGRKQFKALSPQIAKKLAEQIERFGEEVEADVRAKLSETEERIRQHVMDVIFAAYPTLDDPKERAKLDHALRTMTDEAVLAAINDFDTRFSKDVLALEDVILNFDVRDTDEPTVELQKRFLRSWLRLLDEEIKKL